MKTQNLKWSMIVLLVLVLALAACSGGAVKPKLTISASNLGNVVENQELQFQVIATDDKGVTRIELAVDDAIVAVANVDPAQKSVTVPITWKALGGQHTVTARALDTDNLLSDPATMPVTIAFATAPTPTTAPKPTTAAPTAVATVVPTTVAPVPTTVACVNAVTFVADVNFPDGTPVVPNQAFNKTWRIRNTGTCAWDNTYQLVRIAGEKMSAAEAYPLPTTAPGNTGDATIAMTAPAAAGSHESRWELRDASGKAFGWVLVKVTTVIPAPPVAAIISPANGFSYVNGTSAKISYSGTSNYTEITSIALYANGQLLATTPARTPSRQLTGSFDWKPGVGNYDLYVIATDLNGAKTTSAHVTGSITQPAPTCQLAVNFHADRTSITAGETTTVRWDVECANAIYLDGQGVTGHDGRNVAPRSNTTYTLRVVKKDNTTADFYVTINVGAAPVPTAVPTAVPQPTRRNVSGTWVSGQVSIELMEALGCSGTDCGVQGRLLISHGVATPEIDNVSGSINVYSGAMSLVVQRPGASGISCNLAANSASMTCSGSFGTLTFTK